MRTPHSDWVRDLLNVRIDGDGVSETVGLDTVGIEIVGAYNTYTCSVDYTSEKGSPVVDHKWVGQEEIKGTGDQRLANETTVELLAGHMGDMKGTTATVHSPTDENVHVVDYEADGMPRTNQK